MGFIRVALFIVAIALAAAGFAAWRFEFDTPILSNWYYVGIGVALGAAVLLGKVAAVFVWVASAFPLGYAAVRFLFFKGTQWPDVQTAVIIGGAGLVAGGLLWLLGSDTGAEVWVETQREGERPVFCAGCGYYLGTAKNFRIPCPNCGHNVHRLGD